jgi:general secretion pathway protein A
MYERFYNVQRSPFSLTPDPHFLVMTRAHCDVQAGLLYAILGGKGFTVVTGEAGTGKTTLLRSAINSIPKEKLCFSFLLSPDLKPDEFFELAASDFGLKSVAGKPERLRNLQNYLLETHAAGKSAVLFVDEAHRLSIETLEEIRLLTNFETETKKLLQIVLVGQDELDDLLDRHELRQLKQRVEVRLHIGPLLLEDVPMYIKHRWRRASASEPPFSDQAVRIIARISCGIPRLINTICENALVLGFAEGAPVITGEHISEVSRDLRLTPPPEKPKLPMIGDKSQEKLPEKISLQLPPPVFHGNSPDLFSAFGKQKARPSWWPRLSGAQKV